MALPRGLLRQFALLVSNSPLLGRGRIPIIRDSGEAKLRPPQLLFKAVSFFNSPDNMPFLEGFPNSVGKRVGEWAIYDVRPDSPDSYRDRDTINDY
jgi:hypothetical protein